MTVHLIKLAVGIESFEDLEARQKARLHKMQQAKEPAVLTHTTRNTPKRAPEILDGGSIYWVVKGNIIARQEILDIQPLMIDGISHCNIVYGMPLIPVQRQPRRAFQGWRYLEEQDAPPDRSISDGEDELPDGLRQELIELGLL